MFITLLVPPLLLSEVCSTCSNVTFVSEKEISPLHVLYTETHTLIEADKIGLCLGSVNLKINLCEDLFRLA